MAYIWPVAATGKNMVLPTIAPWLRISAMFGKPIDQARSMLESCAVVRPACLAVSVRVLLLSKPKPTEITCPFRSTVRLSAGQSEVSAQLAGVVLLGPKAGLLAR